LIGYEVNHRQNRIMIFGPKSDGTYIVEFRTAAGKSLAISVPRNETAVIRLFQERMPYGLFVPDVPWNLWRRQDVSTAEPSGCCVLCLRVPETPPLTGGVLVLAKTGVRDGPTRWGNRPASL
jgi:hypothetical protein